MDRFDCTEKQFYEEFTTDFYNQVIEEMNLRGQAEEQRARKEKTKARQEQARQQRGMRRY